MIARNKPRATPTDDENRPMDLEVRPISTATRRFLWWFSITMVVVAGSAFLIKLIEFFYQFSLARNDVAGGEGLREGFVFAVSPLITYVIVAAGMACLFIWSWLQGHYRDVEAAKYRMLEFQQEIDDAEAKAAHP